MRRLGSCARLSLRALTGPASTPLRLDGLVPAQRLLSSEANQGAHTSWMRSLRGWGLAGTTAAAAAAGMMTLGANAAAAGSAQAEAVQADGLRIDASGGARIQHKVVFVLGGPGSGKGTQCARILQDFPEVAHFSAGDLLRAHVQSGTPEGNEVAEMIKQGVIVPAEITVGLLQKAMAESGKSKILIDGFPRNASNRETFLRMVGYDCEMVLFFDCPEKVLEARILGRNQGRTDDNIETIKKRFRVFIEQSMPVIEEYTRLGKVARINTDRPVDDIYKEVQRLVREI